MCTDLQRVISVPNRHSHLKYSPGGSFTRFKKNIAFFHPEKKCLKILKKKKLEKKKKKKKDKIIHS